MTDWKIDLHCKDEKEALKLLKWMAEAFEIAAAIHEPMDSMSAEIEGSKINCIKIKKG